MSSGSARFAVAVHVLAVLGYLERGGVELVSSHQIATSVNTNAVVIRSLLRLLKKAGLVKAKEGQGGGVKLAKPPSKITLDEIYAAVESEPLLKSNDKSPYGPCPISRKMGKLFGSLAGEVETAATKVLRAKTLQQILDRID